MPPCAAKRNTGGVMASSKGVSLLATRLGWAAGPSVRSARIPTASLLCAKRARLDRTYAIAADRDETGSFDGNLPKVGQDGGLESKTLPDPQTPAEHDSLNFEEGDSVRFWKTWQRRSPVDDFSELVRQGGLSSFDPAKLASLSPATVEAWGLGEEGSVRYWSYHLLRSGFFVAQAAAGIALTRTRDETADSFGYLTSSVGAALYTEALQMFRQDWAFIKKGLYNEPYDMDLRHRQFDPLFIFERARRFLREAPRTLERRTVGETDTSVWLKSSLYPDYYLNTWHYQTDGWLSSESAGVYETSTETLFLGQQDAMQRTTLVPLARHLKGKDLSSAKVMDLACGTGRFATFVKDNFPAAHVTGLDLSPFYLQEARENMAHWNLLRGDGASGGGKTAGGADFLQAPAEDIPVPDASYDAITCVYLFHELTPEVRKKIVAEMYRVLKPGGMVVLTDSIQVGDRPELDEKIDAFTQFNEPNYSDYVRTDLGGLFKEAGFTCDAKELASRSKVLSFIKADEFFQ